MGNGERRLEHIEAIVNALGGVVWEFDWASGSFTWVSDGCERLLGFSRERWLQPGFWQSRLHPEDAEYAIAQCTEATSKGVDHELEYRMLHADGTLVWVRDIVSVDPDLRTRGPLRGVFIDVTSHKETELALTLSEQRQSVIFDRAGILAASVDAEGIIQYVNDGVCRMLGMNRDELLGTSFLTYVSEDARPAMRAEHLARMRDQHEQSPYDIPMQSCTGELHIIHLNEATLRDPDGRPIGAVVAGTDVTDQRTTERLHRQGTEEFDAVFDMLRDLFFRVDGDCLVEKYRAPSDAVLYAPPELFLGKRLDAVMPDEVGAIVRSNVAACLATGQPQVAEYRLPVEELERDWEARFLPLRDGHVAILVRDITDRKAREKELSEHRDFLDKLLDTLDSGVITVYGDPPTITLANTPAARMLGRELDELVGSTTRIFHCNDDEWEDFCAQAKSVVVEGASATLETRMCRKDGTTFDAEVSLRGLGRAGAERISIIRDVSDRKAAEELLRESEMRFRSIVEEAPLGIHLYEVRGDSLILAGANAAADAILGVDHERLIGSSLEEAFPSSGDRGAHDIFRALADDGGTCYSELDFDDGRIQSILEATAFQTCPGQVAVAFVDMTERRAIELADRLHQQKVSKLAAQLASAEDRERRRLAENLHDGIGQTLAVTRMHLSAAVDDHGRVDLQEFTAALHMLEEAISQTRTLTTELYPPVLHELGLGAGLRWLCDEYQRKHGLLATATVPSERIAVSEEARNVMFRAARELLMNVVKHAETDRAWVSLDEMPSEILLTVSDQGLGMQGAVNGGSGFGLFSLRERLRHLGGTIEVESEPGDGTRVMVTLPLQPGT